MKIKLKRTDKKEDKQKKKTTPETETLSENTKFAVLAFGGGSEGFRRDKSLKG